MGAIDRRVLIVDENGNAVISAGGSAASNTQAPDIVLSAVAVPATSIAIDVRGFTLLTFQVEGTYTGLNLIFEGTVDDVSGTAVWSGLHLIRYSDGTNQNQSYTSTTTPAMLRPTLPPPLCFAYVRARLTAIATGTVTVKIRKGR